MNEAETRAELIDPALKAAGWGVIDSSRVRHVRAFAGGGKTLKAGYCRLRAGLPWAEAGGD